MKVKDGYKLGKQRAARKRRWIEGAKRKKKAHKRQY